MIKVKSRIQICIKMESRIRIRIKMVWIRNTAQTYSLLTAETYINLYYLKLEAYFE